MEYESYMEVSKNGGSPKSSVLNRIFHCEPSILGMALILGNHHLKITIKIYIKRDHGGNMEITLVICWVILQ